LALILGTRLGVYEITAPIGEGGMGQVYRATDTTLGRQVAIKILPDAFAADAERLSRFEREAKALASLNHPHIAAIYAVEKSAGMRALVMELVEGDDLSQRIARGAIPLDEALPIATQIAEALEAAHEQGIIHRDLKPANIKVRADGTVKVLDFGLAKAMEPTGAMSASVSMSPTITTPAMTEAGTILGTAAYMAPEQARGKTVDKRADIWAFGCVFYEMVTGKRAFAGDDVSDVLASVLAREPDWARLPVTISPALGTYIRRCLQKDARKRIHDIADVRLALEGAFETTAPQTGTPAASSSKGARLAWVAAVVVAAALAIPTVQHLRETPSPAPLETRTEIVTPGPDDLMSFALSPDGRQIVFVASGDGALRLWLRALATTTAQPLPGTEGARFPFWAPDSRSIGFFAGDALKRLDLGGGAPQTLAQAPNGRGGTWNTDGVILFSSNTLMMHMSGTGSASTAATRPFPQATIHKFPDFLPDGRRFLFYGESGQDPTGIYLGTLDGRPPVRLTPADSSGVYWPPGWLLWVRNSRLVAQRLDLAQAALTGEPVTLADGVVVDRFARSGVSVAATGLVAYRTVGTQRQLTWVDRSGTVQGTVGDPDDTVSDPRVSPDGHLVAVSRTVQGNTDLWLLDGARTRRLTVDAAADRSPVWSPDGTRIAFHSLRTGVGDLYQKLTSGAGVEERVVTSDQRKTPLSWSADGQFLLYQSADQTNNVDLWVVPMVGDRTPSVFLKTPFREFYGAFSPDNRWVAYMSNESGRMEIYVRPFVAPGAASATAGAAGSQLVSTAGGIYPVWRPDGKELYYLNPGGAMMAAPITATGSTLAPGAPVVLFPTSIVAGGVDVAQRRQYDIAPDGRFLINRMVSGAVPITLLQNWNPEAKK
jgi:Tol biopolymer transport system component